MEVLTAFVRERARWKDDQPPPVEGQSPKPSADIQAILTVLGRRVIDEKWQELLALAPTLDLSKTDLRGADLNEAHLEGAFLMKAHLERAFLRGAHLEGAFLGGAYLEGAYLVGAHLERATLKRAHLEKADLSEANLEKAFIDGAHLDGALNLTKEQIDSAYTDFEQWWQVTHK
jgi:uncharacterized protein YjbI with pentapeptide repeats